MSRVSFHAVPAYKATTDVCGLLPKCHLILTAKQTLQFGRRWGMSMGLWGAGVGVAALYVRRVQDSFVSAVLIQDVLI